jgi:hypothetical protein
VLVFNSTFLVAFNWSCSSVDSTASISFTDCQVLSDLVKCLVLDLGLLWWTIVHPSQCPGMVLVLVPVVSRTVPLYSTTGHWYRPTDALLQCSTASLLQAPYGVGLVLACTLTYIRREKYSTHTVLTCWLKVPDFGRMQSASTE